MKKNSFMEGTIIATLAIVVVKILGMLYVIPFYSIVGSSGGALAPVAVAGAAAGVSNSHLNVAHSGSIGSNAGAMGGKIPYLIITRPKPYNADNYSNFYGYPSNKTVKLSSCLGYTKVKDIHLENISSATDDELNEIESLLKDGVII